MVDAMIDGSPDDFWSLDEELSRMIEIDRQQRLAPRIGRGPLQRAIFDVDQDVDTPLHISNDPYDRFHYLHLN